MREYLTPEGLSNSPSYSHTTTTRGEKLIYVSGQVSQDAQGKVVHAGDVSKQAEQTFGNLKLALAAAGATFENLLKVTIFVVGLDETKWRAVSAVRAKAFPKEKPPASTMVGVTSLVLPDFLIEIEAVASIP